MAESVKEVVKIMAPPANDCEAETSLLTKQKLSAFYTPDNGSNPLQKQHPHPGHSPSGSKGLYSLRG